MIPWSHEHEPEPVPAWWERDPRVWAVVAALWLVAGLGLI